MPALDDEHIFELKDGRAIVLHPKLPYGLMSEVGWAVMPPKEKARAIERLRESLKHAYQNLREQEDPRVTIMRNALRSTYRLVMLLPPEVSTEALAIARAIDAALGEVREKERG